MKTLHEIVREYANDEDFTTSHTIEHDGVGKEVLEITFSLGRALWKQHVDEIVRVGGFTDFYVSNKEIEGKNVSKIVFMKGLGSS